ncbi:11355_t:CDS:2, partial [Diversispora eburnea]
MATQPLRKYELAPPKNLAPLHTTSDLGYPDFYPTNPGQDEDQMTEHNVRNGFTNLPFVSTEHVSARNMLSIRDPKNLKNLSDFMTDIMKRKREINTLKGSSSYTVTVPQTVWDTQSRDRWISQLASNVPLRTLAKTVPKGVEGINLLDVVTTHKVPLAKATWFTKIVGINLRTA